MAALVSPGGDDVEPGDGGLGGGTFDTVALFRWIAGEQEGRFDELAQPLTTGGL